MNKESINRLLGKLDKFAIFHSHVKHIDISIAELYPAAIVEHNTFYVFEADESGGGYKFVLEHYFPDIKMPDEVRACFPLDFYEGKTSAVVSESALDSQEGRVFIIHEFVHCYQDAQDCAQKIKDGLLIYQDSLKSNNYMWELNHEFPYNDCIFIDEVKELDEAYREGNEKGIRDFYKFMYKHLKRQDYEYLIWQEWSEGFARYIENKVRTFLGLELNVTGIDEPLDRIIFYETGSRHIDFILSRLDEPAIDIKDLYYKMKKL